MLLSVNIVQFHDNSASTGANLNETALAPTNVTVGSFGKLSTTALDGQVYAEPLEVTGVTIDSGVNTVAGAAGVHDVVFVATENDSLYAIDAESGAVLWQRSFLGTANSGGDQNNTLGATSIGVQTSSDVGVTDISPSIGITSTPVIDVTNNVLYLVAATKETVGGNTYFVQRLHAINLSDGTDVTAPYLIGSTTNGNTNDTQIYVYGSGEGSVTDPYNGTGQQVVQFNALRENQRSALSLENNTVYVEWASHGDIDPYHGWLVAWDVSNLAGNGLKLSGVFCTSPNDGEAGIWEGGGGLVFEPDNSAFYFLTGNGTAGAPTLLADGFPSDASYNEALVKMTSDPTTTPTDQGPNGWGLKVLDYFIPYNVAALDQADSDFGSGAPVLLPPSAGIPGHPNLMIVGGKDGELFVVDRDNLGHFNPDGDNVLNAVPNGTGQTAPPVAIAGLLSTPAWFNGELYVVAGYFGTAYAFTIGSTGTLSIVSQPPETNFGYVPGSPVVSADGTNNGIVWLMDRNTNELHAYSAASLSTELWNSAQAAGGTDSVGSVVKFAVPTVANGYVYVGTSNSLVIYGLFHRATAAPVAPVLAAATLSGSSINLTWTDATTSPNFATQYLVEESTDDETFTQVATAGAGATSLPIGTLLSGVTYYFRIQGANNIGASPYSNIASAMTSATPSVISFPAGFTGGAGLLAFNGSADLNGAALELTNGEADEAASVWSANPIDVTAFSNVFTFQITGAGTQADGFTFTIQGNGTTAIGPDGGGLGYGPATTGNAGGIPNSVAIKFDLTNNEGEGTDSTGLYTDGAAPTSANSIDLTSSGVNLHSGDVIQAAMSYDGTTLVVVLTDLTTNATATQNYKINIPGTVGATAAYVGFTAGTDTNTATQDILTWTYTTTSGTTSPPAAPSGLGATAASATSVSLNWTNTAPNELGYYLDRATDAAFTQNVVTQLLTAVPVSFTDTTAGLAAGGTYYYRLRSFNSAGPSGYSNVASVNIPLPPPVATDLEVTNVTSSEIDLSWQDNAGHQANGYQVLASVNGGGFVLVASLPATSRPAPSQYAWSDTNLIPDTTYEYHVIAYNVAGNAGYADVIAQTLVGVAAAADSGFETPVLAADTFEYDPAGSPWTFTPGSGSYDSGISANDSPFTSSNPNAPQGSQVAVLQGQSGISQVIPGWPAGTYTLTVSAAQRAIYNNGGQNFEVLIDGVVVATITPTTTTYQDYTSAAFTVAGGTHTLIFVGVDSAGGDNTAFLDNVRITSTLAFVPPTLANISLATVENVPLAFTAANFTGAFTDTNPGGTLQDVEITSLPTNGALTLSGVAVTVDQVIPIAQVGNLVYTPANNYTGPDSFGWNATDQFGYATAPALVNLTVTAAAALPTIADSGFETPVLAANSFQYNPAGSGWTFTAGSGPYNSGISANNSPFTYENPNAPQGSQVGVLQSNSGISQVITGWTAGNYTITVSAAQRGIYNNGGENFDVLVDGVVVATIKPTTTTYQDYTTAEFAVTTGTHTLTFQGLDTAGGDNTAFLDNVRVAFAASFVPPTLANVSVATAENVPLTFAASNFTAAFTDTNPGGTLQAVKIISLPANGTLALSGLPVALNQVIPVAQIGNLVYTSVSGYTGPDTFGWNGTDQVGYATSPATVNVTVTAAAAVPTIADSGFETPVLAANSFQYNPAGSGWTFTAGSGPYNSGISANNSPFTYENPNAPQGSQVGVLQSNSAISQVITGWAAGSYTITLWAAQRGIYNNGGQNFEVLIDGVVVTTIKPTTTTYLSYTTPAFAVTAGTHTLTFLGLDTAGGDNTAFIDNVSVAVAAAGGGVPTVNDSGFETPALTADTFQYSPAGSGWTFTAGSGPYDSGISSNDSPFTFDNPNAPQGSQVAVLQGNSAISQVITGWAAGNYTLTLSAAQRGIYNNGGQNFEILIDGVVVATITPTTTTYQNYTTPTFAVTAGTHTLTILGLDTAGGDNTAFIDNITLATSP